MPTRCGVFVLAGRPNSGKSTLLNRLVGAKIAITSPKPQTTREPVIGARTEADTQYVFVDPPGLFAPRYLLQQAMVDRAAEELRRADAIVYTHPAPDGVPPPLETLLPRDVEIRCPVLTALTKIDLIPPAARDALPPAGGDRLHVSATTGEGLDALLDWCRTRAPAGPFRYDADDLSAQPLRFFAGEFVREAAFAVLGEELPYAVAAEVEEFREARDPVYIRVTLYVERESQKGMVIGLGGRMIKTLGEIARTQIEALLDRRVYLDLWVKVLPKWRTTPSALERLGFPVPRSKIR